MQRLHPQKSESHYYFFQKKNCFHLIETQPLLHTLPQKVLVYAIQGDEHLHH